VCCCVVVWWVSPRLLHIAQELWVTSHAHTQVPGIPKLRVSVARAERRHSGSVMRHGSEASKTRAGRSRGVAARPRHAGSRANDTAYGQCVWARKAWSWRGHGEVMAWSRLWQNQFELYQFKCTKHLKALQLV